MHPDSYSHALNLLLSGNPGLSSVDVEAESARLLTRLDELGMKAQVLNMI